MTFEVDLPEHQRIGQWIVNVLSMSGVPDWDIRRSLFNISDEKLLGLLNHWKPLDNN